MSRIREHVSSYKTAIKDGDGFQIQAEKANITAWIVQAIQEQDINAMRDAKSAIADLSGLADRFDSEGKPGDRWRSLGDVLFMLTQCARPLEQLRLALPSAPGNEILRFVKDHPGVSIQEFPEKGIDDGAVVDKSVLEINQLESAGLLLIIPRNDRRELYLTSLGADILKSMEPAPDCLVDNIDLDSERANTPSS